MADKKPASAPSPFNKNHFRDTMIMAAIVTTVFFLINRFLGYWGNFDTTSATGFWEQLILFFKNLWSVWKGIAIGLMALGLGFILYSKQKSKVVDALVEEMYGVEPKIVSVPGDEENHIDEPTNKKWLHVQQLINSNNPSDWRIAILEADIMLDELLIASGYVGDSVGDKLKMVEPSDMLTLDKAWEAHKVRNRLAHAGSEFDLNEREAQRVIGLYGQVFEEFQII